MSSYFEDLWELQHRIYETKFDGQRSPEVEQNNTHNESMDHGDRRQMKQRRKLAAKHEIDRWRERNEASSVLTSGYKHEDERARTDHSKQHKEASSALKDVETQGAQPLPPWARQLLALTDRVELENEFVKRHGLHCEGSVKDGHGHQQYLAIQQHLQDVQMHGDQQHPTDNRFDIRHESQPDLRAMQQQQGEQAEESQILDSPAGSVQAVAPWEGDEGKDEADDLSEQTRRPRNGKASHGNAGNQEILASDGIMGAKSIHGARENDVREAAKIDQPTFSTESGKILMQQQEPAVRSLPPEYEAGQDQAQKSKLEKKQQQKSARALKRRRRQARKEEEKRQKIDEERRVEVERMNEDQKYWQWMRERQLARPNAPVMSLSKEQYLKEAKQKKERDERAARRQKQREERDKHLSQDPKV